MIVKVHVDFGEIEGPWLAALREDAAVDTGQLVLLVDGDRNACLGIVQKVDDDAGLIYVEPDWTTWIGHAEKWEIRTALSQGVALAPFSSRGSQSSATTIDVASPMSIRYA